MNQLYYAVFSFAFWLLFLLIIVLPMGLALLFGGAQWALVRRGGLSGVPLPILTGSLFLYVLYTRSPSVLNWFQLENCLLFWSAGAFAGTMLGWLIHLLGSLIRQLREL